MVLHSPPEEHSLKWTKEQRKHYSELIEQVDKVQALSPHTPKAGCQTTTVTWWIAAHTASVISGKGKAVCSTPSTTLNKKDWKYYNYERIIMNSPQIALLMQGIFLLIAVLATIGTSTPSRGYQTSLWVTDSTILRSLQREGKLPKHRVPLRDGSRK